MRRIGRIADHFQREVGFDSGAQIGGAVVVERPAPFRILGAVQIDANLPLQLEDW